MEASPTTFRTSRLGYRTQINGMHEAFPPALLRGIALARALYGDPFLVVLDAADTNLDAEGDARLADAIATVRRRGGIVVVVANRRPALAAVENVLALADGRVAAFGRKEEVLNAVLRQSPAPGVRLQRTGTQ
jgi:ABC-type protease/lipase transport system fused ATPase/permease subunit